EISYNNMPMLSNALRLFSKSLHSQLGLCKISQSKRAAANACIIQMLQCQRRFLCYQAKDQQSPLQYELLNERSLLQVNGLDAKSYLQGLITNDLSCLDKCQRGAVFSMLLNAQGRVLFDTIVYVRSDSDNPEHRVYLIESESSDLADLAKHLRRYRLRKKVEIADVSDKLLVAALLPAGLDDSAESSSEAESQLLHSLSSRPGSECLVRDPRLPVGWAHRWLIRRDQSATALDGLQSAKTGTYRMTRYRLGIGEGPVDHPPGRALPLECNAALLNGVSFNKGCYLGQELTARTHHTGVVRKRLAPVLFTDSGADCAALAGATLIDARNGETVGQVRSAHQGRGLALVRLGRIQGGPQQRLLCKLNRGVACEATVFKPDWWPSDVVTAASGDAADSREE
ncbi:hypothetical protein BOX15_Mlig013972g2, partial [Macrostomum lignano]